MSAGSRRLAAAARRAVGGRLTDEDTHWAPIPYEAQPRRSTLNKIVSCHQWPKAVSFALLGNL